MQLSFRLDGIAVTVAAATDETLVEILRDRLDRTATKIGCGIGRCGACTVLMNGRAANACLVMAHRLEGAEIVTAAGLGGENLAVVADAVRRGLATENAFQCGYCAPGMTVALTALLSARPAADEAAIRAGLEGNICRCTGYHSIIRGALAAVALLQAQEEEARP